MPRIKLPKKTHLKILAVVVNKVYITEYHRIVHLVSLIPSPHTLGPLGESDLPDTVPL